MEKLSRVEKYKALRDSVDGTASNANDKKPTIAPVELQKQLKQLGEEQPQEKTVKESRHSHTPPRFSKEIDVNRTYDAGKESFHNEYLDDFLNEVKEYNLEKGNRLSDNTQIDILMQLNPENRRKRTQHYDAIREESFALKEKADDADVSYTQSLSHEELQAEVEKLFEEEEEPQPQEKTATLETPLSVQEVPLTRINPITPPQSEEVKAAPPAEEEAQANEEIDAETVLAETKEAEQIPVSEERLLEETAQLRMQMDDYEGELNELHDQVSKSNRILNVILLVLIIALIAVIAVTIYWLKQAGSF